MDIKNKNRILLKIFRFFAKLKDKKYSKIVAVILIIFILEFIFSAALNLAREKYSDPIMAKLYGKNTIDVFKNSYTLKEFNINGVNFKLTALGKYNPTVKVMYIDRYYNRPKNVYDKMSPFDLIFVWGELAKPYYLNKMTATHDYRQGNVSYQTSNFFEQILLNSQFSNNHIIPASEEIKQKIDNIKIGDLITFDGYIVKVEAFYNEGSSSYWGNDSVSLMDKHNFPKGRWISYGISLYPLPFYFGVGKCDIYYITDLKKH